MTDEQIRMNESESNHIPLGMVKDTASWAAVKKVNGIPRLFVEDKLVSAPMFFTNTDMNRGVLEYIHQDQVKKSVAVGMHCFSCTVPINYGLMDGNDVEMKMKYSDGAVSVLTQVDPDAKILLRVALQQGGSEIPQTEMMQYTDGMGTWVSIASDEWFTRVKACLYEMVAYYRSSSLGKNIFGYHLELDEWFQHEFRERGIDISEANSRKFREWLTNKYKTDAALQAAWGTNDLLTTAVVPGDLPINASTSLLLSRTQTKYVDYLDYIGDLVADRIAGLAEVVKQASDNQNLVVAFYGYYFELCDARSGHYSMEKLLNCPYLDGFVAPVTYSDRAYNNQTLTGSSAFMSAADSVVAAGKLWISESDQRTFINRTDQPQDNTLLPLKSIAEIAEVHKREVGACMVHSTNMYAMDLLSQGWYDDESIFNTMSKLGKAAGAYYNAQTTMSCFDVALVVDEKASSLVGQGYGFQVQSLMGTRNNLYSAGVSFGLIKLEDVLNGRADSYKTYIFANPYRFSTSQVQTLTDKLHTGNKLSVFMYGFGTTAPADVKKLTGMDIEAVNAPLMSNVTVNQTVLSGLPPHLSGIEVNPFYRVTGGQTTTMGTYSNGSVGMALYRGSNYNTVFCGSTSMSPEAIRALATFSGASVFVESNEVVTANQNLVVLTAKTDGTKTVRFSGMVDVFDYFTNQWHNGVTQVSLSDLKAGNCRWLFYGRKADIEAIKLPAW